MAPQEAYKKDTSILESGLEGLMDGPTPVIAVYLPPIGAGVHCHTGSTL